MANNVTLTLKLGAAVSSKIGGVVDALETRVGKLETSVKRAGTLRDLVGETLKLQTQLGEAAKRNDTLDSGLASKLKSNLKNLRGQGVEVDNLAKAYQRLERAAQGSALQARGEQQLALGRAGKGIVVPVVKALAVPTTISANYQSIIQALVSKSGVSADPEAKRREVAAQVVGISRDTGMGRNEVANLVKVLEGTGMGLDKALEQAPLAARFAVGQGASAEHTAQLISALQLKAGIKDADELKQALEVLAADGQAGSFESADAARLLPALLASMEKKGLTGLESVRQVSGLLQARKQVLGNTDEAAKDVESTIAKHDGKQPLYERSKDSPVQPAGVLDRHLAERRDTSAQLWSEASGARNDLMRSIGDSMRPATDALARGIISLTQVLTLAADKFPTVTSALSGLAIGGAALGTVFSAYQYTKGTVNTIRGVLKRRGVDEEGTQRSNGTARRNTQHQVVVINKVRLSSQSETQRVFVVNASAMGRPQSSKGGKGSKGGKKDKPKTVSARNSNARKDTQPSRKSLKSTAPSGSGSVLSLNSNKSSLSYSSGVKPRLRAGGAPGAMFDGVQRFAEVYASDKTPEEKAEGYGMAAGGMGGALAGAAAGALLGSFVPVIGTAIGGLIGGTLGAMGGESLGGWAGKAWFGRDGKSGTANTVQKAQPPSAVAPGAAVRSLVAPANPMPPLLAAPATPALAAAQPQSVTQQFMFTPNMPITVQGGVTDLAQFTQTLEASVRRQFDELMRQSTAAPLYDPSHV